MADSALDGEDAASIRRDLADAHDAYDRACRRVDSIGEDRLHELAGAYDELTDLFDRYESRATGDGDFEVFIEFQGAVASFTEELPEDLRHREIFEDVDDLLQQRRLTEGDFVQARELLAPVREDIDRLDERTDARDRYERARVTVQRKIDDIAADIDDMGRLQRLGEADLDAPVERLREPIEAYNDAVREAFETFKRERNARTVLGFVDDTTQFPLVEYRPVPEDLQAYVERHEAGTEPIRKLLEYADYSQSKLAHYVADAAALKQSIATQQTYLRRLDADPLTVAYPPPPAGELVLRCREIESAVRRFAAEDVVARLRTVRRLPRTVDYERLRDSTIAREQLGQEERDRLAGGTVAEDLTECRKQKRRLEEALEAHPGP
jgi:hypothetical protein